MPNFSLDINFLPPDPASYVRWSKAKLAHHQSNPTSVEPAVPNFFFQNLCFLDMASQISLGHL